MKVLLVPSFFWVEDTMPTEEELKNAGGQKGHSFSMRFIEPGLVRYEDIGDVLVQKPMLDEMAKSFVGCPVFAKHHQDTTPRDFSNGNADGLVTRVWFDANDGWYWCEAMVWDPETIADMRDGYGLSCAYDVIKWGEGKGSWHNIPYENEVLQGRYTHLAIVKRPRYEGVRIIVNQGGSNMKLMFWKKDQKAEEKPSEVELVNAVVPLNGQDMPLEKVMELAAAEQERREKTLANDKSVPADDAIVEVGGRRITVKEVKVLAAAALKNEMEHAIKTDHESGKHKEKALESCTYCSNDLANSKAEAEKAAAKKKADEELQNALQEKKRLEEMRRRVNAGDTPKMPEPPADRDTRLAAGAAAYGPKEKN